MNYAILLAGGSGSRTGSDIPKQFVKTNGRMMATYAVEPLLKCENINGIYLVISKEWKEDYLSDVKAARADIAKIKGFAEPGSTRQLSILKGIEAIIAENTLTDRDTVIIHDAARPFLEQKLVKRCYEALTGHDGVMPVLPMKDTVYLSKDGKSISKLINRAEIVAGQAPELFLLKKYYEANKALLPDKIKSVNGASEPAVMFGMDISIIPGDEKNIKVTSEEDLKMYINACHSE